MHGPKLLNNRFGVLQNHLAECGLNDSLIMYIKKMVKKLIFGEIVSRTSQLKNILIPVQSVP